MSRHKKPVMQTSKNWFGLVGAAIPVLICGGFLLYFNNVRRAFGGLIDGQLGPTMLGIAAFGLLFLVLFLVKLRKVAGGPPGARPGARIEAALEAEKSDFDADAAFERYMARRDAAPPGQRPLTFGRKQD
jgi:hypothetical protein